MSDFKTLLELAFDPYHADKRKLVAKLPHEMSYPMDGETKTIKRELLLTEGVESGLIQTAVASEVKEGANLAKCWFDILPQFRIKGNAYNYPVGENGLYAAEVAEAAEFPNRTEDFTSVAFATKKYGFAPKITNEMIEDGMIDVLASQVRFAGLALQNKVEQICLNEMLASASATVDLAGSNLGLKGAIAGITSVRGYGYNPTAAVVCPDAEKLCLYDMVAQSGNAGVLGSGSHVPPGTAGLQWGVCAVAYSGATHVWEWNSDDDDGFLVLDPSKAGAIGISRPLTVENYDDPIHDLKGMAVSMRMDCQCLAPNAICRLNY